MNRRRCYFLRGFPERFNEVVLCSGLNCVEFGKRVGIDRKTVYAYRDGSSVPSSFILAQICATYGVSADYLLFGTVSKIGVPNYMKTTK